MAEPEFSPNWNVEIIPGSRRVKRMVGVVIDFARFPRSEGYPSDHRRVAEPVEPPRPGEVGGVEILDYRAAANDIIN